MNVAIFCEICYKYRGNWNITLYYTEEIKHLLEVRFCKICKKTSVVSFHKDINTYQEAEEMKKFLNDYYRCDWYQLKKSTLKELPALLELDQSGRWKRDCPIIEKK